MNAVEMRFLLNISGISLADRTRKKYLQNGRYKQRCHGDKEEKCGGVGTSIEQVIKE